MKKILCENYLKKRGFIEFATFLSSVKELEQLYMFALKISISFSDCSLEYRV